MKLHLNQKKAITPKVGRILKEIIRQMLRLDEKITCAKFQKIRSEKSSSLHCDGHLMTRSFFVIVKFL